MASSASFSTFPTTRAACRPKQPFPLITSWSSDPKLRTAGWPTDPGVVEYCTRNSWYNVLTPTPTRVIVRVQKDTLQYYCTCTS
jgi:hypothetical protein